MRVLKGTALKGAGFEKAQLSAAPYAVKKNEGFSRGHR